MCDEPCDSVIITHNRLLPKQPYFGSSAIALCHEMSVPSSGVARFGAENLQRSQCPTSCVDFDFHSTDDGMKSTLTRAPRVWNTKENACEGFCERRAAGLTKEPCSSELQCCLTDSTGFQLSNDDFKSSHVAM